MEKPKEFAKSCSRDKSKFYILETLFYRASTILQIPWVSPCSHCAVTVQSLCSHCAVTVQSLYSGHADAIKSEGRAFRSTPSFTRQLQKAAISICVLPWLCHVHASLFSSSLMRGGWAATIKSIAGAEPIIAVYTFFTAG